MQTMRVRSVSFGCVTALLKVNFIIKYTYETPLLHSLRCSRCLFCVFEMFVNFVFVSDMFKKFGRCLWDVWEVCFVFLWCLFEMFAQSRNWRPIPIIAKTRSVVRKIETQHIVVCQCVLMFFQHPSFPFALAFSTTSTHLCASAHFSSKKSKICIVERRAFKHGRERFLATLVVFLHVRLRYMHASTAWLRMDEESHVTLSIIAALLVCWQRCNLPFTPIRLNALIQC